MKIEIKVMSEEFIRSTNPQDITRELKSFVEIFEAINKIMGEKESNSCD